MKGLNISGTNSDSFSIGHGDNRIELKTIDGELYFRNINSPYRRVLGSNASTVLSPLEWNPNTEYLKGNLFYKNQALWSVLQDFTSNEDFLAQGFAYRRVIDFVGQTIIDIDLNSTHLLNILHSNLIVIIGQKPGEAKINLPSKNMLSTGIEYIIYNTSTVNIKIYDSNSNFINTILPNYKYTYIYNNLTPTGWAVKVSNSNSLELLGIQKNTAFLNVGDSISIFGVSGVFLINDNSNIRFFEKDDASIRGEIFYSSGTDSFKINSFNKIIAGSDIPNKICFFNNNDILYLKNNTIQSKTIIFHKFF